MEALRRSLYTSAALVWISCSGAGFAQGLERTVLPIAAAPFAGKIGLTAADSTPDWPEPVKAPAGAPNVLVIMTDDIGFGTSSTFGGPVLTPYLDALAREGARYNRFNTTAMCSPTRAALLTGRNSHAVGSGAITDVASGYPGYSSVIPRSSATIARILRDNGYNTAMFGKHHNIPRWEASLSGPFDHWPTGLGFEFFYGFIIGDTDQWNPRLYRNTLAVDDAPQAGSTLDNLLANEAIHWLHQQQATSAGKPFFLYYATGTGHAPHQAPTDWIDRFRGKFDQGWDEAREETFARQKKLGIIPANSVLTPRPQSIPAWSSLTSGQQREYARYMEVFAGMVAYQDFQIGRLLDELRRMGQLDNTVIFFIEGDNGASGEGGPTGTFNEIGHHKNGLAERRAPESNEPYTAGLGGPQTQPLYPVGWAWAMNAPFQWTKQVASHLGGIRNGLVIRWPEHIAPSSSVRSQFAHVSDITPTILDITGIPAPRVVDGVEQQVMTGRSLTYTFVDPMASEPSRTQYFEMLGNRGIYRNGWFAGTSPKRVPWKIEKTFGDAWSSYAWELYDLNADFSQSRNLAARQPERLKEMQDAFLEQARLNKVLPIDDELSPDRLSAAARYYDPHRKKYEWWGSDISIAENLAPSFTATSFTVTIDLDGVAPGASGVMLARGSWFGGWSFYLKDGYPSAAVMGSERPEDQSMATAKAPLSGGSRRIVYRFTSRKDGKLAGGELCIEVDGVVDTCSFVSRTPAVDAGQGETVDIGKDSGVPVTKDYPAKANFPGRIAKVTVELN